MAASTKFVQKYTRKPNAQVKDEFFISANDVIQVNQFKDKIEKMHQILISFENETDEGQWLILEGEPVDRRNAKYYITAMCSPSEKKQVQFPSSSCSELTDPATLEYIEKTTNAFIRPLKKIAQFEISGTDLAVTLALSQIEELAGSAVVGEHDDMFDDEIDGQDEGVITISPNTHNASLRLSSVLERALSANSDGICSADDYRKVAPAVQRVLVNCLQDDDPDDIDDDMLFADGRKDDSLKGSKLMMFYEGETRNASHSSKEPAKEETVKTSPVSAFADKMTELNISTPPVTPLLTKQQEYLRSFGMSVGFVESEVDKALQFVEEKTRPSDFLDMLNSLQKGDVSHENDSGDDVVILETETVDLVTDERTVVDETLKMKNDGKVTDQKKMDNAGRPPEAQHQTALPDGYREMLIRDFNTEDENCSVEELKRRNSERQKLLRQNFETQQGSEPKQNSQGQAGKKQNSKSKNKRKKNKQQQQSVENKTDRTDMHDKQFRLENNDKWHSQDDEQTCVLRVWNKDQGQTEAGKSTDEPFQTTPKRKNCKGRNNQQQWPQHVSGNNNQRQNSPKRACQGEAQWSGPVGRGNFRKPTQVVAPVNAPSAGYNKMALQGQSESNGAELRYIVIDGSNVAMTHGNGKHFSCKGIKLCVDYFRLRGHDKITVFVPQWRQYQPSETNMILDQNILQELKEEDILVFTPSRRIGRKLVVAYDDRFVLELAEAEDGIIVSNDQYRDLMTEKAGWRKLIEERLLMYSFVRDRFMPPNDPLGRDGPCLDDFLRVPANPRPGYNYHQQHYQPHQQQHQQHYKQQFPQPSGHGHFQQGQGQFQQRQGQFQQGQGQFQQGQSNFAKAVNQGIPHSENSQPYQRQGNSGKNKTPVPKQFDIQQFDEPDSVAVGTKQVKGQWKSTQKGQGSLRGKTQGIPRTDEETEDLFKELRTIFPDDDQEEKIRNVLTNHDRERDLTKLTNYLMSILF